MLTRLCRIGAETCDLLDKLLVCNPRERMSASQALDHDYFWTDPLPADPKTWALFLSCCLICNRCLHFYLASFATPVCAAVASSFLTFLAYQPMKLRMSSTNGVAGTSPLQAHLFKLPTWMRLLDRFLLQLNLHTLEDRLLLEKPSVLGLLYRIRSVTRFLLAPHTLVISDIACPLYPKCLLFLSTFRHWFCGLANHLP